MAPLDSRTLEGFDTLQDVSETDRSRDGYLSEDQIEEITGHLRAGRRLPPHLFPHLFETSKEYQLAYAGKARRADVLADTMAVPLQPVKTFGESEGLWSNMLILGDNLQVLRRLIEMKDAGELRNEDGTDGVRLCYIDPPFATRREFGGSQGERAYMDRVEGAEFVEFLRRRLILVFELLADDGALYVHLDTRKVHYVKVVLDEIFGESRFRNEIIWRRTTSHSDAKKHGAVHETLLYYAKGDGAIFDPPLVALDDDYVERYYRYEDDDGERFMSADLTAMGPGPPRNFGNRGELAPPAGRHWAYDQEGIDSLLASKRIFWTRNGIPRLKKYLRDVEGMPTTDVWSDILPVVSWSTERTAYPTQKPRALVERVVASSSKPGDIVLDCFVGSGTTLEAAEVARGGRRRWIGVDCGKFAIYTTLERLLRRADDDSPTTPFTLLNAGLYDYKAVRDLPWTEYREFALQLFQCRPSEERIAGVTFDGFLGDHLVLVYNFHEHEGAKIGEGFVNDLASVCKGRLGSRCFIIAPALAVEPYEDYLDVDGTRFFFLRIPYSIIAELHKRAFSELRQPDSKEMANATIDSVGFDFIQPPRVECSYVGDGDDLVVKVSEFESEAYAAAESDADIADLAMVMIDYDYDGEIFDLDAVHYKDDLASVDYRIEIPAASVGEQLMLIYLDVFGNEHREVKRPADFRAPARSRRGRRTTAA